jgi:hypothetical protein
MLRTITNAYFVIFSFAAGYGIAQNGLNPWNAITLFCVLSLLAFLAYDEIKE